MTNNIYSQELMQSSIQDIHRRLDILEKQVALSNSYSVISFWSAIDKIYSKLLPLLSPKCIICDYENSRENYKIFVDKCMFGGGILERYQCPKCDCIFGPQKYLDFDEEFIDLDYRLLYSRYEEGDTTQNETQTFFSLDPQKNGLYLDWGCGAWGSTVQDLRSQNYDVWGYEPSAPITSDFIVNTRDQISAKFDAIFSNNVIEHFRNPVDQFKDFSTILKPGGKMAHSSPCYDYNYAYTRFHTLFLTGRSPHILAERTGFKITNITRNGEYINHVFELIV
jgi:SAM-dependent methyltransferase